MTATASAMDEISSIQASVKASWRHLESKKRQSVQEHDQKRQQLSKAITEGFGVPTASEIQNLRKEWWTIATNLKSELEALNAECDHFAADVRSALIAANESIDSWAASQAQELLSAFPDMHDKEAIARVKNDNIGRELSSRQQSIGHCLFQASAFIEDNAKLIAGIDAELAEKSRQWRVV